MSYFRNMLRYLSGSTSRNKGLQDSGPGSYSGPAATNVTVDLALQLSAVWACAKLISEAVASLPVNVYDVKNGIKTLNTEHPLARLLNGKPNRWQTRQEYFETLTYQLVLLGNNYSVIQRNGNKDIISLIPLMTESMQVDLKESGEIIYTYTDSSGVRAYADSTIWHNKLFGNGIIGLSPLSYARNSVGVGLAAEQTVSKVYKNGGKPSGLLTIDKVLKEEQRNAVKKNFADMADGNEDRLYVLEAGMSYTQISLSPQDIELLASRRFQIEDICRFFGVPSVLVNDTSANTTWGSGLSQIVQGFYKFGLRPMLERYEASMKCNLLSAEERLKTEIEFDFSALLRPDLSERIKNGKEAVTGGILTPNEVRESEGWKAIPGGDTLFLQQQMTPIEQLEKLNRGTVQDATPENKTAA